MTEQLKAVEKQLVSQVDGERLMQYTTEIARWVRLSGSEEERQSVEWVVGQLRSFGVESTVLEHDAYISLPGPTRLAVTAPESRELTAITHAFAIPTPVGGVEAEVVYVGTLAGLAGADVRGKIVLIDGLATPWAAQAVSAAGALGHIHICPGEQRYEMIVSPVWGSPSHENRHTLPKTHIVSVNTPDGNVLKGLLKQGPVKVRLEAEVDTGWRKTPLILAEIKGNVEPEKFIFFTGHLDSWHYGAMDNGSSNALMLEIARILAGQPLRRSVRFAFWSGHSHGRYSGSTWYNDEYFEDLAENCVANLNTDSAGARGATVVNTGSFHYELKSFLGEVIREYTGQEMVGGRVGRSSDESFWATGVPSLHANSLQNIDDGGLNPLGQVLGGKADSKGNGFGWWWHTPEDTVDKVDRENLARDTRLHLAITYRLATAPVLPVDHTASVGEILKVLEGLQEAAGDKFDLNPVLEPARKLAGLTQQLNQAVREAGEAGAARANQVLLSLSRLLIPIAYTRGTRFEQEPAMGVPPVPGLADAAKLKDLEADSDEAKFIAVALRRGRNRVRQALLEATAQVESYLRA